MAGRVEWHGDRFAELLRAEMARRLAACCLIVAAEAKRLLSVAGTGAAGRDGKGRFKRRYGVNPSAPGEPPHKQTGHLRRSVTWEVAGLVGRVGTNLLYGRWLELGTRLVKARPWLRVALRNVRDQVARVLSAPLNFR